MRFAGICRGIGAVCVGLLIVTSSPALASSPEPGVEGPGEFPALVHQLPSYVQSSGSSTPARARTRHLSDATTASVSDVPGNVYYASGGLVVGPNPNPEPADLISAAASDDGTTVSFSAVTAQLNNPSTDPNWRNDTYIGWAIDPDFSGTPKYFAYFQLNPDGSYNGELTYAATDTPVSCSVSLSFDANAGYQARFPAACLAGVTSFQWFAYSLYDTVPLNQDPGGTYGFGKALPDFRRNGGVEFAPPIAGPPTLPSPSAQISGLAPGYWLFARDGGVFSFGAARFYGSEGGVHLNQPIVGGAATLDGRGYWLVAADGGVFSFGDARFYGSTGAIHLRDPIVAIVGLPTGNGYWLVASDGGVFAFGGARFYGSTGGMRLNQPIVGGAATPDGLGYWLVARDGGVFSFGDAVFKGSGGAVHLNKPVVAIASTDAGGYWLVASDGGVFSFGGARFFGSTGSLNLVRPIEGIAPSLGARGYRMVASDGGIFDFGNAGFFGSRGGLPLNQPIVGMASVG